MQILQIDQNALVDLLQVAYEQHCGIPEEKLRTVVQRAQAERWGIVLGEPACTCTFATTLGDHHDSRCSRYRKRYAHLHGDYQSRGEDTSPIE